MGEKDSLTKKFMSRPDVFADAFNYLIYEGQSVIKPENLHDMDTSSLATPHGATAGMSVHKIRDVLKRLVVKSDGKMAYMMLGIENQTEIHYAMPVRNMLYDAIQYDNQVENRRRASRRSRQNRTGAEYLSGFGRSDKLIPVITLVIYWGEREWDAPTELFEMFDEVDKTALSYVQNYKINLIAPATISKERLIQLHSEFRQAMWFIRCSTDSGMFEREILYNPEYEDIDSDTVRLLNSLTKTKVTIQEGEERVNMCVALQQIIEERGKLYLSQGRQEGREEGMTIGREEGMTIGREEGMTIGREEGMTIGREEERAKNIAATIRLLRSIGMGEDEIADKMREQFVLSPEEIAAYMAVGE